MHANSHNHTCLSYFLKDLQTWSILQKLSFAKIYIKKNLLPYFRNEEKNDPDPTLKLSNDLLKVTRNHCNAFKGSIDNQ